MELVAKRAGSPTYRCTTPCIHAETESGAARREHLDLESWKAPSTPVPNDDEPEENSEQVARYRPDVDIATIHHNKTKTQPTACLRALQLALLHLLHVSKAASDAFLVQTQSHQIISQGLVGEMCHPSAGEIWPVRHARLK